jgi:hypothetical protein
VASNVVNRIDISGTSFLLDVTPLELSLNLSVADFQVTHNGIINNNYTKTNDTLLQYSGTNVTLGTRIVARRITPLVPSETNFISTTTAVDLSNALDKLRLECDELSGYTNYIANQVVQGGLTLGAIPINNGAFPTGWVGDTNNAPSRNATANILSTLATIASPALTGNPTAPTQASTDNSTRIATTAFVRSMMTATALTGGQISFTHVPTGLIVKAGSLVVTVAGNVGLVTYPVAFPSALYSLVVVNGDSVTPSGGNPATNLPCTVWTSTTFNFQINTPTFAAGVYRVNYIALGA